jgi:dTDP-glucose 4,6-dehydratase
LKKLIITGGAGFIGSTFVNKAIKSGYFPIVIDKLTYAGNINNISEYIEKKQIEFFQVDINDQRKILQILQDYNPFGVINFAAESHVDNSINNPSDFVQTNIFGVFNLLEAMKKYLSAIAEDQRLKIKFVQISTDEVFGELTEEGYFNEKSAYSPNSPYSSTKAAGDLMAKAWAHTYKMSVVITHCSNNFGPRQHPEKLIPVMIQNAIEGKLLPVYGNGQNIRDWIHVDDHVNGIMNAFEKGQPGQSYCFGGNFEIKNIDIVNMICKILDELRPLKEKKYSDQIKFVSDRLGHDFRYAIDDTKAKNHLGFCRKNISFELSLKETVLWYLNNQSWVGDIKNKSKNQIESVK